MKILPALLLCLLCTAHAGLAQDAASPAPAAPNVSGLRRSDAGIFWSFGGPVSQGNGQAAPSVGLMLRRSSRRDPQRWRRIGIGYGSATRDFRQTAIPVSADTALLARSFISERMVYALAGTEIERQLVRRIFVSAGIETQAGYAGGGRDSFVSIIPRGTTPGEAEGGYYGRSRDVWSAFGTALFFAGFRTYDKRYTVGLDAFAGGYAAYRKEAGAGLFDMSLTPSIGLRMSAGYRF